MEYLEQLPAFIEFISPTIWDSFLYFILGGAVLSFFVGLWLILRPQQLFNLNQRLNTWFSARRSMRFLEVPRPQERFIYRHHVSFGLLTTAIASYSLFYLLTEFNQAQIANAFGKTLNPELVGWLLSASYWFLLGGNLFVVVIGSLVLVRPSLLKGFEQWCNQWVSTRVGYKFLDVEHAQTDGYIQRHPRPAGLIISLCSLYILFNLWTLLQNSA